MKISFCTTCKGRTHHLKQTLLQNIRDNAGSAAAAGHEVEFVVLDYDSRDGMKDWILNDPDLKPYLENGTLKYARHPEGEVFHHAHAKNMAHRLASGDVLCNLDADNRTGPGFAVSLAEEFTRTPHAIVVPALRLFLGVPDESTGFYGRIALRRDDFMKLGGYDEKFRGWGPEDDDLINRAVAMGLHPKPFRDTAYTGVVSHSSAERVVEGLKTKPDKQLKQVTGKFNLHKMKHLFEPVQSPQRNGDGYFGTGRVELGPGAEPLFLGKVEMDPRPKSTILGKIPPLPQMLLRL